MLSRELGRSKGARKTQGAEPDPGLYINLDDNGLAMGALTVDKLRANPRGLQLAASWKG